ncbi:MAG: S-adenosyl-l-methionine hydroxide adenosyltransferase family protein [Blastopirellula sp. JB062]
MTAAGIITLLTDFGADSPYVAEMKGAILSVFRQATILDLTHSVAPQDVRHGAYLLDRTYRSFPSGTVHVGVVDPGVGSQRKIIAAEIAGHTFVLPDNGLLSAVALSCEATQLYELANERLWRKNISTTFHGRDIMGPVGAFLAAGGNIQEVGPPLHNMVRLDLPVVTHKGNTIWGEVAYADSFGNLVTNITAADLDARAILAVSIDGREVGPLVTAYSERQVGSTVAIWGSSGRLEISVVGGNAAAKMGGAGFRKVSIEVKS